MTGTLTGHGDHRPDLPLQPGAEPLPGYRLLSLLGRGGFGEVWKAESPGGFEVALKFVRLLGRAGDIELKSLDVIKRIRHPHLLSPFGSWSVGTWLVIGMEVADRTLLDRYREANSQGLPGIPTPELIEYMLEAAKGIDYLNEPRHPGETPGSQGIQHRDIKPQNLLLVGGSIKVADFGLARLLEHSLTSHTGNMTPAYSAPEFFNGQTSSQSDQYSLAVTYCYLSGGRLPFTGSLAALMAGHLSREPDLTMLPEAERPVVARALAKEPKKRWPNCREFIESLRTNQSSTLPESLKKLVARLDHKPSVLRFCTRCGGPVAPYPPSDLSLREYYDYGIEPEGLDQEPHYWCPTCEENLLATNFLDTGAPCPNCSSLVPTYHEYCGVCGTEQP